MLGTLIAIVVIIGLLYFTIIAYQHFLLHKVCLIEKKNKNAQRHSLRRMIIKVEHLTLAGESLKHFNDYKKRYSKIRNHSFDKVDRLIKRFNEIQKG